MRLVKNDAVLLQQDEGINGVLKHIEICGRTCYKSEDKITEDSAKLFVEALIKRGHTAMLEHGTVYLTIPAGDPDLHLYKEKYKNNPYSRVNYFVDAITGVFLDNSPLYITTNYRVIIENGWADDVTKYFTAPDIWHIERHSFKLTTSIGVTRELNRHRVHSIAEQSTRYCNYSKDKFGNQITFCKPSWLDLNLGTYERVDNNKDLGDVVGDGYIKNVSNRDEDNLFLTSCLFAEDTYKELLENGWQPQQAREVLPLCTATEIIHTAFDDDWKHFFDLRYFESTGKVHPNMLELSTRMKEECEKAGIWDDIIKSNKRNI